MANVKLAEARLHQPQLFAGRALDDEDLVQFFEDIGLPLGDAGFQVF